MILAKVLVTIAIVTGLSVIAERVSPRAAGILAGYPAGSAISLFFIGMELGADFAGASAMYNILGLTALLSFLFLYYQASLRICRFPVLAASLIALGGFLAVVSGLNALQLPAWGGLLVSTAAIPLFQRLYRVIPNAQIASRVRLSPRVLLFRATLSAAIILTVTGAAHLVGPNLAGLLSAFPATVFPLLLIIHTTYGARQAHTIIKNVPTGLWSLVFYSLTVSFTYPRYGIYWGTIISFGVATIYLFTLPLFNKIIKNNKSRPELDGQLSKTIR